MTLVEEESRGFRDATGKKNRNNQSPPDDVVYNSLHCSFIVELLLSIAQHIDQDKKSYSKLLPCTNTIPLICVLEGLFACKRGKTGCD